MIRTDYQTHLLEEYCHYLQKCIVGREEEEIVLTRVDLASALMRAFEKGVMKGILYENTDDVTRVASHAVKHQPKPESKTTQPKEVEKRANVDDALDMLASIIAKAMTSNSARH